MKAVIPLAGGGTRFYSQTHTKLMAMVRIAGKTNQGHLLTSLVNDGINKDFRGAGEEVQLTDALQWMVDIGSAVGTFDAKVSDDCARLETLLEARELLLSTIETEGLESLADAVVVPPVDIGCDETVTRRVIGPNASIDKGDGIDYSVVKDSTDGRVASLADMNLTQSIIGDSATVRVESRTLEAGDNSDLCL